MTKQKKLIKLFMMAFVTLLVIPIVVCADTDVASVGETKYNTLQEAINNAEGKEVKLLKNIVEDVVVDKNITLNLNSFNLTNVSADTIYVKIDKTLSLVGSGTITNISSWKAPLFNNGTVTIDGPTLTKTTSLDYYVILNHGFITVKSGTISFATTKASLVDNGYYNYTTSTNERLGYVSGVNNAAPKMIINGGTFDGGMNTIKNDDGGILEVNAGTFTNNYQVAIFNVNTATINGGTFNTPTGNDKTNLYNAYYSGGKDEGKLTVNGGTFNADYVIEGRYNNAADIVFNGGTFNFKVAFANTKVTSGTGTQLTKTDAASYITAGKTIASLNGNVTAGTSEEVSKVIAANPTATINVIKGSATIGGVTSEVGTKATTVNNTTTQVILSTDDKSEINGELTVNPITDTTKTALVIQTAGTDAKPIGIYDISIVKDETPVTVNNTNITIRIKVGSEIIKKYTKFEFVYLNGENAEKLPATVDGEYLVLKTTHLSEYAVVGIGEITTSTTSAITNPKTSDSIVN